MALKLSNNASSTLAGSITATSTSLSVASDDAGKFPTLSEGDWFPVTIVDSAGNLEILKATARAGAILTVERGQEGTTATSFDAGARVELRLTAAAMMAFLPEEAKAADSAKLNGESASYYQQNFQNISGVEFGSGLTGDRTVNIDFHADDTNNDRSFGIVRLGGKDGKAIFQQVGAGNIDFVLSGSVTINSKGVWHAGNFDPDDKLDATAKAADSDKLDGKDASDFATAADGALARSAVQPGDLGEAATANIGTTSGTVAAGDDSRIVNAAKKDGSNATGTWPVDISGQAATADNALGVGQTWQDVSASRVIGTTYQNTTGRSIMFTANASHTTAQVSADGSTWVNVGQPVNDSYQCQPAIVPPGHYYRLSGGTNLITWAELR